MLDLFKREKQAFDEIMEKKLFSVNTKPVVPTLDEPRFTIFTTCKSFTNPHIALIQKNALTNLQSFTPKPQIIVFGDAPGTKEICEAFDIKQVSISEKKGPPSIPKMFALAQKLAKTQTLVYANADIIFDKSINNLVKYAQNNFKTYLLSGQRFNVDVHSKLTFEGQWQKKLLMNATMHPPTGKDYFIFNKKFFKKIPELTVGRAVWDDWILHWALTHNKDVYDTTKALPVFHQNHERKLSWSKLKDKHSKKNLALAGGDRTKLLLRLTDIPKEIICVRQGYNKEYFISDKQI